MSYVGLGASLCVYLDIPIILRSLACSFACHGKSELPTQFDLDFLFLLEAGTELKDPSLMVKLYKQAWWKGTAAEKRMGPLNAATIDDAVFQHRKEVLKFKKNKDDQVEANIDAQRSVKSGADYSAEALLGAVQKADCFVSGMAVSAQAERRVVMRRATAFHLLHQASVMVDLDLKPVKPAVDATDGTASQADQQDNKLCNAKWATGNDLTLDQVLGVFDGTKKVHEGYIHELVDGLLLTGEYSEETSLSSPNGPNPPILTTSGSILTVESPSVYDVPPETNFGFPDCFDTSKYRLSNWESRPTTVLGRLEHVQVRSRDHFFFHFGY